MCSCGWPDAILLIHTEGTHRRRAFPTCISGVHCRYAVQGRHPGALPQVASITPESLLKKLPTVQSGGEFTLCKLVP